jgi:serine phosphatase RsbU (regulator of sigma subunit)
MILIIYYISDTLSTLFGGILTCYTNISLTGFSGYATPYHLIFYSVVVASLVYYLVKAQTLSLIRTRKLLKSKEETLNMIENQRVELELKNKSITDSLIYAQRIQEALLPSEDYFRRYFEESFILYKPKDIVSGDFYWIGENSDYIFVVAADCTGHGVPGALMSMIGHELLDKIINVDKVVKPSVVLEIMSKGLERTFSREKNVGTIIRDGMDIGLCVVDRSRKKIIFSGAFLPLYIIRENRLIELRGDKHALGMNPGAVSYTDHEIALQEDDMLYLFSDGYVDQFGGSENKKFMYRRFRYLLLTIHRFPMEDQKSILEENIKTWMGGTAQVDDILVMGFKPM